ncbi:12414_t:CDS:2 [Funneliformis geosporum]|uniref:13854_t:CDS:1 n=1 Tax=Funneliformis geosporum TaxID=1117311 RepID=A0A9W4SPT0_9GLOM|nr:12414_t:CDS:2 [Funneliformis geosporum]CAI2174778.1 13854_t:CDS:2 [Funneliformis geosporum]
MSVTQNIHCPGIDYLVVIDFEATCDENNTNPQTIQVTKETAEIIEFAWVIVDTSTLEVVYQHSQYVKPEATPLTPFCTSLTNITWENLEIAGTLKDAITTLDDYIKNYIIANNKAFCFCTHGAWDLRIQLPREARDKRIELPPYLAHCRMFDLKQEYQRWQVHHPDVILKSHSLNEMCVSFELQVGGQPHTGLGDSLTMVNIIRYFCSFGHPDVFVNPIDTNADLNQFKKEESKVIHLAGLPYDVTQPELEAWFSGQGVRPTLLWMIRTPDHQKPSGSGFGIFASHEDAMACLEMNGRTLGDRAIEVSPSSERVTEAAGAILASFPMSKNRLRPGDWVCPTCQFHNFASRRTCFKCNAMNPNPSPVPGTPPNFTLGDWMCPTPQCNFHNYASRTQCLRCGTFKPQGMYGPPPSANMSFRPGDWICPNPSCVFQNFASRTICMRCGATNHIGYDAYGNLTTQDQGGYAGSVSHGSSSPAPAPFRPGDWYCPSCNTHNFASRFQCIRCAISKPPQVANSVAITANMKPGDWLCSNEMCGYHNFAKRTHCAKCGMPNNSSAGGENGFQQ